MKLKRYGWTLKDERLRKHYGPAEFRRKTLKFLLSAKPFKARFKFYYLNCFYKLSKKSSLGRYRRYCLISYSSKVVFQRFKLSRHVVKSMAALGHLCGVRKASF